MNNKSKNTFFTEVVYRYTNIITNLSYRLTGNFADAEDLTQEVLLRAYTKQIQFKPDTNLLAWLY